MTNLSARSSFRQNTPSAEKHAKTHAILFDLDGTLMDSNYEHVTAWGLALRRAGVEAPNAFLHRCIGMRGDLLVKRVYKEIGKKLSEQTSGKLDKTSQNLF